MSQRYTLEDKIAALDKLKSNGGNIALTALQLEIPERTLYNWRRQRSLRQIWQRQSSPLPPPEIPAFDDDLQALHFLRAQIMKELVSLSTMLNDDADLTTPRERVTLMSQLLDRLMKLDAHLKPYIPVEQVIRFEYSDPDEMEDTDTSPKLSFYEQIRNNRHYYGLPTAESPAAHNKGPSEDQP
jgi:transposase-like protein